MSYKSLLKKGRRTLARTRVKFRQHRELAESKKIKKLTLERNKAEKEAARLAAINEAQRESAKAKAERQRELEENREARKQRVASIEKQAKGALSGLKKAIKAIDDYANKDTKKKSTQTKMAKTKTKRKATTRKPKTITIGGKEYAPVKRKRTTKKR